jgi:hypothetical protein
MEPKSPGINYLNKDPYLYKFLYIRTKNYSFVRVMDKEIIVINIICRFLKKNSLYLILAGKVLVIRRLVVNKIAFMYSLS